MTDTSLLKFPSEFPIKVMGRQDSDLRTVTQEIVERHAGSITFRSNATPGRSWTVMSVFLPISAEPPISAETEEDALPQIA